MKTIEEKSSMKKLIIVNRKNKILDYGGKDIIHQNKILHRSIHGFLVNKDGKLLCRKISVENKVYPGYWSTGIGAHIKEGESNEEKLKMICKDFKVEKEPDCLGDIYVSDEFEHEISPVYLLEGEVIPELNFPITKYCFFSPEEIKKINPKTTHLEKSLQLFLEKKLS